MFHNKTTQLAIEIDNILSNAILNPLFDDLRPTTLWPLFHNVIFWIIWRVPYGLGRTDVFVRGPLRNPLPTLMLSTTLECDNIVFLHLHGTKFLVLIYMVANFYKFYIDIKYNNP